jgi:tyrosine-protein phosphatase YwqE
VFKNLFSHAASKLTLTDFSAVKADMHSHFIPGIDDGARTLDDSVTLIRRMHELGYKKLITTPHIQHEFFRNTPEIILNGLEKVRGALKSENIPVDLEAAAEYLLDDGFEEKASQGNLLTFSGKYLLVELSYFNPHPNLKTFVFNLQVDGYKVILAHPERYTYWFSDFSKYEDLKDRGVFFQINLVSLAGFYPDPVKKMAEKLMEKGMIEFVGSDMHNTNYMQALERSLKEKSLAKLVESGRLLNATLS